LKKRPYKKERDDASKKRLEIIRGEIAELREENNQLKAQWEAEKKEVGNISEKRNELEQARHELEEAQNEGNLEKAAALRYGKIPEIEKELKAIEEKAKSDDLSLVQESVTEEQIAEVVGRMTGIPITKLVEGEREKLLHLPETLHQRVVGQDEAVEAVSDAIIRARAGIQDPNRPLGSFLFLGPTGVGKTNSRKLWLKISLIQKNIWFGLT
jgi:ATPases with chaperone activity, ATP-binding subunit